MSENEGFDYDFEIDTSSADAAHADLTKRGYDPASAFRFARAARSHTERNGREWNVWLEVEARAAKERDA